MGHLFSIFVNRILARRHYLNGSRVTSLVTVRNQPRFFEAAVGLRRVEDTFSWQLQDKGGCRRNVSEKRWLQQRSWGGQRKERIDAKKEEDICFFEKDIFFSEKKKIFF